MRCVFIEQRTRGTRLTKPAPIRSSEDEGPAPAAAGTKTGMESMVAQPSVAERLRGAFRGWVPDEKVELSTALRRKHLG